MIGQGIKPQGPGVMRTTESGVESGSESGRGRLTQSGMKSVCWLLPKGSGGRYVVPVKNFMGSRFSALDNTAFTRLKQKHHPINNRI